MYQYLIYLPNKVLIKHKAMIRENHGFIAQFWLFIFLHTA